jgi:hypothetical protein
MTELHEIQQLLSANAGAIETHYLQHGHAAGEVSPMQLADALRQLLQVFASLSQTHGAQGALPYDDPSELGEHGINLVADLAGWAERLELPRVKFDIEKIAVGVALWVARHNGEIRELETVVNGFAASANSTSDEAGLRQLFHAALAVLAHVAPDIAADVDQTNPGRPWRVLNFNCAIIATRTQDAQLMRDAFDTLSRNLPQDAPAFFEEGLKQSEKPVYGPTVKNLMQEYFARWTVRH